MRRAELVRFAVVEPQAQAVAVQQHQFTVDAGKRGERCIALDLVDRKPPGPVAAGIGAMRMDITGPAQAVAPALPPIYVGGDDAGPAARVATPASMPELSRRLSPGRPGPAEAPVSGRWYVRGLRQWG